MKRSVMTMAVVAAAFVAVAEEAPVVVATASLRDGSTLKGEFRTDAIRGATVFSRDLSLVPSIVRSINFTGTNGESDRKSVV